jgi:hypothetical protein
MPDDAKDDEMLWGAEAIAKALNLESVQIYYLLKTGALPVSKVGGRWVSTRRKLRALVDGPEAA